MAEKDPRRAERPEVAENNEATPEVGVSSKTPVWMRFSPIIIVAAIVILECVVAIFLAPSGNSALAKGDLTPEQLLALRQAGFFKNTEPVEEIPCVEIDMGEYTITHSTQSSGSTIHVSFHLYGVIDEGQKVEFVGFFTEHENRVRDLIRSIIRETEISELADPGLGLIKSQILEKVNRLLGKPMLQAVVFSDYTFVER